MPLIRGQDFFIDVADYSKLTTKEDSKALPELKLLLETLPGKGDNYLAAKQSN